MYKVSIYKVSIYKVCLYKVSIKKVSIYKVSIYKGAGLHQTIDLVKYGGEVAFSCFQ